MREGQGENELIPELIPDFGASLNEGRISYNMLIRGGYSPWGEREWLPEWTFANFQEATKVNEELRGVEADHPRIVQHKSTGAPLLTEYSAYDALGNLTGMIDPNGATFTYIFDALNRQTDAFNPETGSPYYETTHLQTVYDENNNVIKITEHKPGDAGIIDDAGILGTPLIY